jgi:cysteine desulfurase
LKPEAAAHDNSTGEPMTRQVYLDNQAATPLDPRVLEAMMPYLTGAYGNAASRSHSFGWVAEKAVEAARRRVAELAGATAREIVFTSGATESINLALKGAAEAYGAQGRHIVTAATEHRAVLDTCMRLEKNGFRVTVLPVGSDGRVDPEAVAAALLPETILVSIMYANNEIGTVNPVREIGALCHARGVLFHCDAVQAFGKIPVQVDGGHIDLMSLSAHKLYGPKGAGALYVRRRNPRVQLAAQIDGGGHEYGWRSGTLNVPGIAGFGAACAFCAAEMADEAMRLGALRDRLQALITAGLDRVTVNGSTSHRLPHNLNLSFDGVDSAALLVALPDLALSSGSACTSATAGPSHVLRAIGLSAERARSSVRFGLGRFTTDEEIEYAAGRVVAAVRKLRRQSPTGQMD